MQHADNTRKVPFVNQSFLRFVIFIRLFCLSLFILFDIILGRSGNYLFDKLLPLPFTTEIVIS